MTNLVTIDAGRDVRGDYKVDASRGRRVGRVSSEWFSRPADERYLSLSELMVSVQRRAERSRARTVDTAAIRVEATRRRLRVCRHDYDEGDNCRLLSVLTSIPCKVMLAGYPSELYARDLAGWNVSTCVARTHADAAIEALWINYDVPTVLHDHSHMGYGFRQREAIRSRRGALVNRIEGLDAGERSALYFELAQLDPALFAAAAEMVDG